MTLKNVDPKSGKFHTLNFLRRAGPMLSGGDLSFKTVCFRCHPDDIPKTNPIFAKLKFPVFSPDKVQNLFFELNSDIYYVKALHNVGFPVIIPFDKTKEITELLRLRSHTTFCTCCLLHLGLAGLVYPDKLRQSASAALLILNGLLEVLKLDECDCQDLVVSAFYHFFRDFVALKEIVDKKGLLVLLFEFLNMKIQFEETVVDELLCSTIENVFADISGGVDDIGEMLLSELERMVSETDKLSTKICCVLQDHLKGLVFDLNPRVLLFFKRCHRVFGQANMEEILMALPLGIVAKIQMMPATIERLKPVEPIVWTASTCGAHDTYKCSGRKSRYGKVPKSFILAKLPVLKKLHEMINPELLKMVNSVIELVGAEQKYISLFLSDVLKAIGGNNVEERAFDVMAVVTYVIAFLIRKRGDIYLNTIFESVINSWIFGADVTFLNESVEIMSIKAELLRLLLEESQELIVEVFKSLRSKPLVMGEVMYLLPSMPDNSKCVQSIVRLLMNDFYAPLTNVSPSQESAVYYYRLSILAYLERVADKEKLRSLVLNEKSYVRGVTQMLLSDHTREFAANLLAKTAEGMESWNRVAREAFYDVIRSASRQAGNFDAFDEILNIFVRLNCLNLEKHMKYILKKIQKLGEPHRLLFSVVDILTQKRCTNEEVDKITSVIKRVYNNNPPMIFFGKFVRMLSGMTRVKISPNFVIVNPTALSLIVSTYSDSDVYLDVLKFFYNLCLFSGKNRIEFNLLGLDLLFLRQFSTEENRERSQALLQLYGIISSFVSSFVSVAQFFTTLYPGDGPIHPYAVDMLDELIEMVRRSSSLPQAYIILNKDAVAKSVGLAPSWFNKGFTLNFWIFLAREAENSILFEFTDESTNVIRLSLDKDKFRLLVENQTLAYNGLNTSSIRMNEWINISLIFGPDGDKWCAKFLYNGVRAGNLVLGTPQFSDSVKFRVGNKGNQQDGVLLGSFSLLPVLNTIEAELIYHRGIRCEISDMNPYFQFIPMMKGKSLVLDCRQNVTIDYNIVQLERQTFPDILALRSGVKRLLPVLFKLCESGVTNPLLFDKWILVFSQSLTVNNKAQLYFCENAGFQAISLALSVPRSGELPCSVTFYDILLDLLDQMVNDKLKSELVKFLLLNLRIWLRCDFATASYALQKMADVVIPSAPQLASSMLPFRTIIAMQRSLLYFEPVEETMIDPLRSNFTEPEVVKLREQLWQIAARIGEFELDVEDIHAFVIGLMTAGEKKQLIDMLAFSESFFSNRKTDLLHANVGILAIIYYTIAGYDEDIVVSLLTFLCSFHQKSKYINETFDEDLDMIINELPDGLATPVLFDKIIDCCKNEHPELFPVLAWAARILGPEFVARMFKELTPNTLYFVNDHCTIYPFACLFNCSDDTAKEGLKFLLNSAHTWKNFIAVCNFAGNILGESSMRVQKMLIEQGLEILTNGHLTSHIEDFYELAFFYIFLQASFENNVDTTFPRKQLCREEIGEASYSSCYSRDILTCFTGELPQARRNTLRMSVCDRLSSASFKWDMSVRFVVTLPIRYGYFFSLRRDENGIWTDLDLAKKVVDLFHKTPIPRFEKQAAFVQLCVDAGPQQANYTANSACNELAVTLNDAVSIDSESEYLRDLLDFQRKNASRSAVMRSYCKDKLVADIPKCTKEYTRYVEAMSIEENNTRHNFVVTSSQRSWEEETNSQIYEIDGTLCGDQLMPIKLRPVVKSTNEDMETEGERCQIVNGFETIDATFRTTRGKIVIAGTGLSWRFGVNMIDNLRFRTRYNEKKSIEIFLKDRESIVLSFPDDAEAVLRRFPNLSGKCSSDLKHYRDLWRHRKISNFEYLVRLNFEAGRSFKDIDQYPIMPKVLARLDNYDLKDPSMFRDFTKPILLLDAKAGTTAVPKNLEVVMRAPLTRREVALLLGRLLPFANVFPPESGELPKSFADIYTVHSEMELIPEFYSSFEVMKEGNGHQQMEITSFASTTYELIYKHRKALESDTVSNSLNHWIDMIFGMKQRDTKSEIHYHHELFPDSPEIGSKTRDEIIEFVRTNGQLPAVVFTNPHPRRKKKDTKKASTVFATTLNHPHKLRTVSVTQADSSRVKVAAIDTSGNKFSATIDMKAIKPAFIMGKTSGPFDIKSAIEIIPYASDSFLMIERESTEILELGDQLTQYVGVTSYVSHFACDGSVTAFSDDAGAFTILVSKSIKFTTRSFGGRITCTAVSEKYACAVACTEENHMMLCSVNHCELVRIVKLPGKPKKVMITPGWGFIVVNMEPTQKGGDEIATYTITGDLLARSTIDGAVTCFMCFATPAGFDYLAVSNSSHHVFLSEAFYLRFLAVKACDAPVLSLSYRPQTDSLIIVSSDGAVTFLPIKTDD